MWVGLTSGQLISINQGSGQGVGVDTHDQEGCDQRTGSCSSLGASRQTGSHVHWSGVRG